MKKNLMVFLMLFVSNNCLAITNAEIKEEIVRFSNQTECKTRCSSYYTTDKTRKNCQSYCKKFAVHNDKIDRQTSFFEKGDCLEIKVDADEDFSYNCYEAWEEMFENIKDDDKECYQNIDKYTIFKAFTLDKLKTPKAFIPMIKCYQKAVETTVEKPPQTKNENIEENAENTADKINDKEEEKQEKEEDAYCDSEEGRKDKRKCKRKEKIAEQINSKFIESLNYTVVKKKCEGLISKKNDIFTDKKTLDNFTPKRLRQCKRTARKMNKYIKRAGKIKNADANCLELNSLKEVKKCIRSYKKAKRKCKKLVRKINKCSKKSYEGATCSYSGASPNCDVINANDLENYKMELKSVKEALKTFRKAKREKKKEKRDKKKEEKKKKKANKQKTKKSGKALGKAVKNIFTKD